MFEGGSQLLQSVAITTGSGVGGDLEQFGDGFEGQIVPELENDDFPLFVGKLSEGFDGGAFDRGFSGLPFEPVGGFQFPRETPPETPPVVERPIPEGPDQVVPGFAGSLLEDEQCPECVMQNILGLRVAQSESPSVQDHLGRAAIIKLRRPMLFLWSAGCHFTR